MCVEGKFWRAHADSWLLRLCVVLETSKLADRLGYDVITVGDHFFNPPRSYERIKGDPDRPDKLDPWITLTALAAQTTRVKLATRVSPIPFYLSARLASARVR